MTQIDNVPPHFFMNLVISSSLFSVTWEVRAQNTKHSWQNFKFHCIKQIRQCIFSCIIYGFIVQWSWLGANKFFSPTFVIDNANDRLGDASLHFFICYAISLFRWEKWLIWMWPNLHFDILQINSKPFVLIFSILLGYRG